MFLRLLKFKATTVNTYAKKKLHYFSLLDSRWSDRERLI